MLKPKYNWVTTVASSSKICSSFPPSAFRSIKPLNNSINTMNLKRYSSVVPLVIGSSSAWTSSNLHHCYPNTIIDSTVRRGGTPRYLITSGSSDCRGQQRRRSSTRLRQSVIVEASDTTNQDEDSLTTTSSSSSATISPRGQPVARGSILKVFRGGLVAVRVDDDLLKEYQEKSSGSTPNIVGITQGVPSEKTTKTTTASFNSLGKRIEEKPFPSRSFRLVAFISCNGYDLILFYVPSFVLLYDFHQVVT